MFVVVNGVDEMTNVVQERAHFQQEAFILIQVMKLGGFIK